MDGILIIDKPAGLTSHDVVARVRRILGTRRVGHTGTLDPFATGVLVLLVGNATRLAQFIDKDEKEYEALVRFGFETDTGDLTGRQKAEGGRRKAEGGRQKAEGGREKADGGRQTAEVSEILQSVKWETVLSKFRGEISQTPPMYSAKKLEGKKLYELARAGVEVERRPIPVTVSRLELLPLRPGDPAATVRIRVACSAGTYIRTLAEEIGREVGTGAHLIELRRIRAGRFGLAGAIGLAELERSGAPETWLRPSRDAVEHLPAIELSPERVNATKNGLATRLDGGEFAPGMIVRMLDQDSNLIAIGTWQEHENTVKPKIVLV